MSFYEHDYMGCLQDEFFCHTICGACWEERRIREKALVDEWIDAMLVEKGVRKPVVQALPNAYVRFLTLTLPDNIRDPSILITSVNKIAQSKQFGVTDMPYCIELTKSGTPHLHAIMYTTKKYIDNSKIKKIHGYRTECKPVVDLDATKKYLDKDENNISLLEFCRNHNIERKNNAKKIVDVGTPVPVY